MQLAETRVDSSAVVSKAEATALLFPVTSFSTNARLGVS